MFSESANPKPTASPQNFCGVSVLLCAVRIPSEFQAGAGTLGSSRPILGCEPGPRWPGRAGRMSPTGPAPPGARSKAHPPLRPVLSPPEVPAEVPNPPERHGRDLQQEGDSPAGCAGRQGLCNSGLVLVTTSIQRTQKRSGHAMWQGER